MCSSHVLIAERQKSPFFRSIHGVSKNDTDVAHHNFDPDQPIFIIFGKDVAERVCYRKVILCLTFHN